VNFSDAFLQGLITVLFAILNIIKWLVILAAVISWVSPDPRNPIVQFLYRATEPMLRPLRRILPPGRTGGIDFTPILLILIIIFVETVLSRLLLRPVGMLY
jgi:YggT family protein